MEKTKILLEKDVVIPEKQTIEVYNVGTIEQPRYIVTEKTVRKELSTHKLCSECGGVILKNSYCSPCYEKTKESNYLKMPFKEWDGVTPVVINNSDEYFWGSDDIEDYLAENEINPSELCLVICSPNYLRQIEEDYWADEMPENYDDLSDFNKEFVQKLKEINEYITTLKPLSWGQGIYRTEYTNK